MDKALEEELTETLTSKTFISSLRKGYPRRVSSETENSHQKV